MPQREGNDVTCGSLFTDYPEADLFMQYVNIYTLVCNVICHDYYLNEKMFTRKKFKFACFMVFLYGQ